MIFCSLSSSDSTLFKLNEIIEIIDEEQLQAGIFDDKTFCITGSLSKPRKEITLLIKNYGGKVVSSVSSKSDIPLIIFFGTAK